jgi:DNA polymerase-4
MQRHVLHVNTDDFYASVVRVKDSTLRRRPLIVSHLHSRGTVVSASYEARVDGVRPGLTLAQARRLCPRGAVVPFDAALFQRASDAIFRVIAPWSPLIERARLDEIFIDYTGCERLLGGALDACVRIQREILQKVRLQASIGLATSKLVSQVASGAAKRSGLLDVYGGYEPAFLAPHPVERMPGVGPKLAAALRDLALPRIGDIPRVPVEAMERVFGKIGRQLHERARGIDRSPVRSEKPREEMGEDETFEPDVLDRRVIEAALARLVRRLGARLRKERVAARRLSARVRYADGVEEGRETLLPDPEDLDSPLFDALDPCLYAAARRRVRVRALGIRAWDFRWSAGQLDLFAWRDGQPAPPGLAPMGRIAGETNARHRRLCEALDTLRKRFGERSVVTGREIEARAIAPEFPS